MKYCKLTFDLHRAIPKPHLVQGPGHVMTECLVSLVVGYNDFPARVIPHSMLDETYAISSDIIRYRFKKPISFVQLVDRAHPMQRVEFYGLLKVFLCKLKDDDQEILIADHHLGQLELLALMECVTYELTCSSIQFHFVGDL